MNLAYKQKERNALNLSLENIYKGSLILVNHDYHLNNIAVEKNTNLINIDKKVMLEKTSANNLLELIKNSNIRDKITFVSGYRRYKEQKNIYTESLQKEGFDFTNKYIAFPNHSEHQTGLAIDLAKKKKHIDFIRPFLPYDGAFEKFRKTAFLYGFIERYKKR